MQQQDYVPVCGSHESFELRFYGIEIRKEYEYPLRTYGIEIRKEYEVPALVIKSLYYVCKDVI